MSLEKVVLRCFRTLSLSLTSLLSRPVFIQESDSESSMSTNSNSNVPRELFIAARRAWPERGNVDLLPAPVRRVYDSWLAVPEGERLVAVRAAVSEGFPRLTGRDSMGAQARDLTLAGSPLPGSNPDVVPLTIDQIRSVGAPPAATEAKQARVRRGQQLAAQNSASWVSQDLVPNRGRQPRRLPTPVEPQSEEEAEPRSQSAPAQSRSLSGSRSPERESSAGSSRGQSPPPDKRAFAELERKLARQEERIRQLFAQQLAEPHEDVSSAYVVLDEVWHKVGKDATADRCSWLNINALKKREVGEVIRSHSGTFPHFPCELDVIGTMKKLPGVKDAQITLVDFAQNEVSKFMRANARTVRLSGTVFSRVLEMQMDLAEFLENDPDATEIPLDWMEEFLTTLVGAARGSFAMSLDTQTTLRLAVSHRLEKAMKVDHLTTNPLKAEREDFIPPLVIKRIEDAAKRNLDLSWALDHANGKQSFSGRHPANSSRGGKPDYARQRGRGGGAPKGAPKSGKGGSGGRGGRGKGRGAPTAPRTDPKVDGDSE